jgi:hypothetical protein
VTLGVEALTIYSVLDAQLKMIEYAWSDLFEANMDPSPWNICLIKYVRKCRMFFWQPTRVKIIKDCCVQSESRTKRRWGGSGLRSKGRSGKAAATWLSLVIMATSLGSKASSVKNPHVSLLLQAWYPFTKHAESEVSILINKIKPPALADNQESI